MDCEQPKKYSFSMGNLFFVLGLVLILSIGNRVNLNELALKLSEIFITFPFVLLAIFFIKDIKLKIIEKSNAEFKRINQEIKNLRKKQENISEIDILIEYDEKILELRNKLNTIKSPVFKESFIFSILLFTLTIIFTFFDLAKYLEIHNNLFLMVSFLGGTYFLAKMIKEISIGF